ncbi:MAG: FtsQ-type POTRA domain-containing protein [candidate division NC10 bacterium]|nr:FtsQ-type POTRA domain-containing protein [candidate division NC10 bacterium]
MRARGRDFRRRSGIAPRARANRPQGQGAHRKRWVRRLLFPLLALAILVFLGAWGFRLFQGGAAFRLEAIQVEGCAQISAQEVRDSLHLESSSNLLLLDLSELSRRLRSNPWIREASVRRHLPHTLVVKIEERRPAGILPGPVRFLVSEDGVILSAWKGGDLPPLPFLHLTGTRGLEVGGTITSNLFQAGSCLWRDLQQMLTVRGGQIREIWEGRDGSLSMNLGEGMPSLRWRAESLEEQLARLKEVMSLYHPDWRALEYIDLRFSGKVILKPVGKGGGGVGKG